MDMPEVEGVNLRGLAAVMERHPEVTITTTYGNWIVLHAAHVLAVEEVEGKHPLLAFIGNQIHDAFDDRMMHHSTPSLRDIEDEDEPWESPVSITLATELFIQVVMSLAGVCRNVKERGLDMRFEEDLSTPPIEPQEMIAAADRAFVAALADVDPEFPMVIETLYQER